MQHKKIKNIIYSIDGFHYISSSANYDFLYKQNDFWHDLLGVKVYYNVRFILCALVWSRAQKCVGNKIDIYKTSVSQWNDGSEYFGGLANFLKRKANADELALIKTHNDIANPKDYIESSKSIMETHLLDFVREHPHINFHFIIPAFSRLFYLTKGRNYFAAWREVIRHFVSECATLKNVRIYGFDTLDYADDISHYKDVTHHDNLMSEIYLESIATQTHILDSKNIESYLKTMQEKVQNYDISQLP